MKHLFRIALSMSVGASALAQEPAPAQKTGPSGPTATTTFTATHDIHDMNGTVHLRRVTNADILNLTGSMITVNEPRVWQLLSGADARVRAAYLGVGVEVPNETLRAQLALPEGTALVVNYVDESGPSKDLIHKHDVLTKLDDQLLINGQQLVTLVRLHKPGDAVQLTIIRAAKPMAAAVKLAEKEVPPLTAAIDLAGGITAQSQNSTPGIPVLQAIPFIGDAFKMPFTARPATQASLGTIDPPKTMTSDLDRLIITQLGSQPLFPAPAEGDRATIARRLYLDLNGLPPTEPELRSFVEDKSPGAYENLVTSLLRAQPRTFFVGANGTAEIEGREPTGYVATPEGIVHITPARSVTLGDGEFRLTLRPGGDVDVTITDRKTGEVTFKGPVKTAEQWKALPDSARTEIDTWRQSLDGWRSAITREGQATTQPAEKK